jgi:hypothetical protein
MRINIDVTNHCNKKCSFCPMKDRYKNEIVPLGYMDMALYVKILDQLPRGTEIDFHKDGEPLLHPYLTWMIRIAKRYGFFTHIVTNGLLLGKKKERIVESGLDLLTISIVDDIPRDTINEFMEYKQNKPPLTQLKIYKDYDNLPIADKVIKREIHNWTDDKIRKNQKPCSKLLNYIAINWDGSWAVCCVDYKRELSPFNVKDVPIEKGIEFNKMIYKWQKDGLFLPPCKTCNYWQGD